MSRKKDSNGVINSLAAISESFRQMNLSEDGILQLLDNHMFLHMFEDVPDFREQCKVKYKLSSLLMMVFLIILERGKVSFVILADVIWAKKAKFQEYGLIENGETPSHDTIRRILTLIDKNALYENTLNGFYSFLQSLERNLSKEGDYRHIAFDGKEMRGSGRSAKTLDPKHNAAMLNVYDTGLATVIECVPIDEKENEIPVAQKILETMDLKNIVLTADALHCQKETARIIKEQHGIYVLTAKDNQPLLLEEIKARFKNPKSKIMKYKLDGRTVEVVDLPKNYVLADDWPGLRSYARMVSARGKNPCERYFISNTNDHRLICDAIENRWSCENFHKVKDLEFYEDGIRSTDKRALQSIAILNNLAVQLIRIYESISGYEFRRAKIYFQENPIECMNLILGVMSSEEIIDKLVRDLEKKKKTR